MAGIILFRTSGKTFVVITNFRDSVLIKNKKGNFLITTRNPDDFIESIKRMAKPEKVGS